MPYPMEEVIKRALTGIAKAQREYERGSGYWLWQAPEYYMTTYIAKEILANNQFSYFVTLENNVRTAIYDAGGMGPGRPRLDLRPEGRFDILLWWANGTPRAVIEVKKQVRRFEQVREDVARICSVLDRADTIRHGLVAYYDSWRASDPQQLRQTMADRRAAIESGARRYVARRGMTLIPYRRRTAIIDDSAWVAVVLKVSRR